MDVDIGLEEGLLHVMHEFLDRGLVYDRGPEDFSQRLVE